MDPAAEEEEAAVAVVLAAAVPPALQDHQVHRAHHLGQREVRAEAVVPEGKTATSLNTS